ncbi:energy transducer TonB [Hymenobacter jeollabukensis]|uniref:Energy transducer TonB n=1 Tax=Hymenobacter jeollabukensis TaxID=2025313 RepID=A0A5R8WHY7_9BACT|nr:energy transducer TonB [Hymenobacter jeollabukensis]TLM88378.1 energy transducer TonB [Hymenobacter jeollabukensis]
MQRLSSLLFAFLLLLLTTAATAQTPHSVAINHVGTDSAAQLAGEGAAGAADAPPAAGPAIYHVAEVMPAFPGGAAAQLAFLRDKLKYPEEALRKGVAGKVLVQFVVDERGHLLDPQVVRGLGAGLDEEALRLVRIMPWWTPGLVGGQPVKVQVTLPIVFRALE